MTPLHQSFWEVHWDEKWEFKTLSVREYQIIWFVCVLRGSQWTWEPMNIGIVLIELWKQNSILLLFKGLVNVKALERYSAVLLPFVHNYFPTISPLAVRAKGQSCEYKSALWDIKREREGNNWKKGLHYSLFWNKTHNSLLYACYPLDLSGDWETIGVHSLD